MMMTAACRVTSRRRSPRHALAQEHVAARDDGGPVDPFDRDVLADGAGHDRVPFGLEAADRLHRVEAHGALGAPVVLRVAVRVTLQPEGGRTILPLTDRPPFPGLAPWPDCTRASPSPG